VTIRQVNTTVTVTAPDDPYDTQVTIPAGTVMDVEPGGPRESAIGLGNLTDLSGGALTSAQTGSAGLVSN
jgi:hypothetical protein